MNIILLAQLFRSIFTVITNQFSISGDEKDNSPDNFSKIKSTSPSFTTSKSSGHLDPILHFLTFSEETWHSQRQIVYNFSIKKDQDGHKVHYTIKYEDEHSASYKEFYFTICQKGHTWKTLGLKNDRNEHHVEDYHDYIEILATMQDMTDCFKLGKIINQNKQLNFTPVVARHQASAVFTNKTTVIKNSGTKTLQIKKMKKPNSTPKITTMISIVPSESFPTNRSVRKRKINRFSGN